MWSLTGRTCRFTRRNPLFATYGLQPQRRSFDQQNMKSIVLLAAAVWLPVAVAAEVPKFGGDWIIAPELCKTATKLGPPKTLTYTVDQSAKSLTVHQRTATGLPRDYTYSLVDGEESSNKTPHDIEMKSRTAWEGDALVIRTVVGASGLALVERWTLHEGGRMLRVEKGGERSVFRRR